jgi:hypothetical protein
MNEEFKFTLVEIAPFEEFLKMTPEERLRQNDIMANRLMEIEASIRKIFRGWNFYKSQKHVHSRNP